MPLDPEAAQYLNTLAATNPPSWNSLTPVAARAQVAPAPGPHAAVAAVEERTIPGPGGPLVVRIYRPVTASSLPVPCQVFFHGGGWVVGSLDSHDSLARALCQTCGSVVVSVDYRLAPEYPFPAAVNDSFTALNWVAAHAGELKIDPTRLMVSGDSAGGNLAAVTAHKARDAGGPKLAGQILLYPMTDSDLTRPSYHACGSDYFLTTEVIKWFWDHYLPDHAARSHANASPLQESDLSVLPPALILVAEYDPLYDEGVAYADRLAAAGVSVKRIDISGQIHGFLRRPSLFTQARSALQQIGCWVAELAPR